MGLYKNFLVSACSVFIVCIYTNFIDDLDILFADRTNEEVKALYQVGVALVPDEKYRLGFIRLKGVGVSVMVGDDIQAIRFHTGFPF